MKLGDILNLTQRFKIETSNVTSGEIWEKFPILYKSVEKLDKINAIQIKSCLTMCPIRRTLE